MGGRPFGYTNLLQELLLALVGYSGDVFIESISSKNEADCLPDPDRCDIHLAKDVDWVDEPDRQVLNELVKLGYHYQSICIFIEFEQQPGKAHGSIYRRALTAGLIEILDVYQAAVLQVQQQLASEPLPVLSSLHYFLSDFQVLLPQLHQLVFKVQSLAHVGFNGAKLLELLHARMHCGIPILQSCMQRLLWHCNQVLFKQLKSWMVHGVLLDPHAEFFIRPSSQLGTAATGPTGAAMAHTPAGSGLGGRHEGELAYLEWHTGFQVDPQALPTYISYEVAETVVFIGKAVRVLCQPAGGFQGAELLPQRDTLEFALALHQLQQQPRFNRVAFERCVESIRAKVASMLWQLVVVQADLMSHLAAIKSYFLLAKGEFYHNFLVDVRKLMAVPPRPATADADVNIPFQQSALKSTAQHDHLFQHFRLHWSDKETKVALGDKVTVEVPKFDANWDMLYLQYQVEWPLGLLLTPPVLARYNSLFQFLLRLKRVQLKLEDAWQSLCAMYGRSVRSPSDARLLELLQLRHHMAHLVTNLQIYIQVDVIEANYKLLEERIGAAQDFSEAERAHANYLHALMQQSFLTTATICRTISALFRHVQELCTAVEACNQQRDVQAAFERVPHISRGFNQHVTELYTFLHSSRLQDANKAPHLRQFYLRLNFNEYVGKKIVTVVRGARA